MSYRDPQKQKEAQKRHYENNKEAYIARNKSRKSIARQWLHEYKTGKPCMDCGLIYPHYVMDFDHRDPRTKSFGVCDTGGRSLETLQLEIAKCDLVCSNCHRFRTFGRQNLSELS